MIEKFFGSAINKLREGVQGTVNEDSLPTLSELGYKSSVGIYGGKLKYNKKNDHLVFDMSGFVLNVDRIGDAVLRTYDDHTVKDLIKLYHKHPHLFFKFLIPGTKRYRGKSEEIYENIKRLGLDNEYGLCENGIEIKNKEIYEKGRPLQDIYRSDIIENNDLGEVDRFTSLTQSAQYIRKIHDEFGAIGEVLPSDIIFQKKDGNNVSNPILNIPDIVYNIKKGTSEIDKKTTDLLDFVMSIAIEELRRVGRETAVAKDGQTNAFDLTKKSVEDSVKKAIKNILYGYGDPVVISILRSFLKRGRLTMQGDEESLAISSITEKTRPIASIHNKARLDFDKNSTQYLRALVVAECEEVLNEFKTN